VIVRLGDRLAEHAAVRVDKPGRRIALAKLVCFFFRGKWELHVTNLLMIRLFGTRNGSNPVARRQTVMNRPLMQGSPKDSVARHPRDVKLRDGRFE
jgi:hypothetical protein